MKLDDLKNLDITQLKSLVVEKKDIAASLVILIVAIFIIVSIVKNYNEKAQIFNAEIPKMQEKISTMETRDKGVQELNNFKNSFPRTLKDSEVIMKMTDFAKLHQISILSLSPAQRKNGEMYDLIKIHLRGRSRTYTDVILFLRDIETSPFALRVELWSATLTGSQGSRDIGFETDIGVLNIKP